MFSSSLCVHVCVFNLKKRGKKGKNPLRRSWRGKTLGCVSLSCYCKSCSGGDWSGVLVLSWFPLVFPFAFLRALEQCPVHSTSLHGVSAQQLAGAVPGCAGGTKRSPGTWDRVWKTRRKGLGARPPPLALFLLGSSAPRAPGCASFPGLPLLIL